MSTPGAFQARARDASRVELEGELDLATVPILREVLAGMPKGPVTLDLSRLEFIDSSGLREISVYAKSLDGSGPLILENVPDCIVSLLKIVGYDRLSSIVIA